MYGDMLMRVTDNTECSHCFMSALREHIMVLCSVCGVLFENRVHSLLANHIALLSPLYLK